MSEYVDTKLINCNRLASVESKTGNDSNPAVFTNSLNETVKLDVGDKVSLERAFINEVGAGNPQTIEFKGQSRGSNAVATYTNIQYGDYYYKKSTTYDEKYRLGYYRSITTNEVVRQSLPNQPPLPTDETVDLRDNLAPLVFGYFITSNEYPNYIQHPRRFTSNLGTRGNVNRNSAHAFTKRDSEAEGLPLGYHTINSNCPCFADYSKKETLGNDVFKQKVDNTRYTLFIKDKIAYSVGATNDKEQFPTHDHNGIFSEATYYRVREKLSIEVNKGFNTPSAVANQITQQLTETKNENIFEIFDNEGFVRPLTKTIETNTFKPINAQNQYNFGSETYDGYVAQPLPVTDGNITQLAVDYIATFGYIGVKRPEIFEAGRKMHKLLNTAENQPTIYDVNRNLINEAVRPDLGFNTMYDRPVLASQTVNKVDTFVLGILYTEENLKIIRDLFDAQALYPELWDNLEDTIAYSDTAVSNLERPTVNNSRFFHMNKYNTRVGASPRNEAFGDDAFTQRAAPNNIEMSTQPVFFNYDDSKRNYFVEPQDYNEDTDGYIYGFAEPVRFTNHDSDGNFKEYIYLISITTGLVGGVPRNLYSEDTTPVDPDYQSIERGRKIGFDFHSTAYSTAIISPFSGYFTTDIGVAATVNDGKSSSDDTYEYATQINHIRSTKDFDQTTDFNPYMTMSYIGANNPAIDYNSITNRFELKRFHTGNNTGNKATADNPSTAVNSKSLCPSNRLTQRLIKPAVSNQEAGNTVYKINPRPPQFGFSPTFKPYFRFNQAYRTQPYPETAKDFKTNFPTTGENTIKYDGMNLNIEPYKIFDSHGGIYIDDWGFDEDNWEDNLWDILGFDYYAVNSKASSKNVLTKRIDNENSSLLYRPTTNAEVVQTDTKNYVTNQFGAVMYYNQLPYPTCVPDYRVTHVGGNDEFHYVGSSTQFTPPNASPLELWNEVAVLTESTTITATDLQKSVLRPYYTIRSNILEGATAIGGNPTGANLPIISIVDKYSGASDYFLGNPSDIQFTVTKPTMIADITTSIHDSDGEYANVDKTSAVIYKIQKVKSAPVNIIEEILKDDKKK